MGYYNDRYKDDVKNIVDTFKANFPHRRLHVDGD